MHRHSYGERLTHTHTHLFNGPFSGTTQLSRYQKGKTNLDFTEARDSEWQWHQLEHMQVCTLLQTDNDTNTPPLIFLQAGCPSCCPTNRVKALKALIASHIWFVESCFLVTLPNPWWAWINYTVKQTVRVWVLLCIGAWYMALSNSVQNKIRLQQSVYISASGSGRAGTEAAQEHHTVHLWRCSGRDCKELWPGLQ